MIDSNGEHNLVEATDGSCLVSFGRTGHFCLGPDRVKKNRTIDIFTILTIHFDIWL